MKAYKKIGQKDLKQIIDYLHRGLRIQAIKLIREVTSADLNAACGICDKISKENVLNVSMTKTSPISDISNSVNLSKQDKLHKTKVEELTNYQFKNPSFLNLKKDILRYERLHGYYIIDMISIEHLRAKDLSEEAILDLAIEFFDDSEWPPLSKRAEIAKQTGDQSWEEYLVSREEAYEQMIEFLVGGSNIGHSKNTIQPDKAEQIFHEFENLFSSPKRYYMRLGLGNPEYVFSFGVCIIDKSKIGLIWIVEDD